MEKFLFGDFVDYLYVLQLHHYIYLSLLNPLSPPDTNIMKRSVTTFPLELDIADLILKMYVSKN